MKTKTTLRLLPFLLLLCHMGCENIDYDHDLIGKWQLRSSNTHNCGIDSVFLNFDNHIFVLQRIINERYSERYFGKFAQKSDSLIFEFTDSFAVDTNGLAKYFKWDKTLTHKFKVEYLSSHKLLIKSQTQSFTFRKF